ncbi:hypothetical protein PHYBOEH_001544, partial [Phytophthora boehmeriae]
MAITKFGYGAIAMAAIGTIYNTAALVMPMWTVNKTVNAALSAEVTSDVSDATQLEYVTVLATAAGMDAEQFDKFLDKSCGLLGMATMSFGGMSMSNGLMAIIAMI